MTSVCYNRRTEVKERRNKMKKVLELLKRELTEVFLLISMRYGGVK